MFLEDGYHRIFLCRDSILLITLLLSGCLCLSQLAFYGEQKTWNEAYSICVQHGGLLVSVNSSEMYDMMGDFSKGSPWKTATGINEPVWIGIHATDSQGQSLEWADCVPTTWTQWHPSEPKSPDIYQCAYLKSFTTNMWMDICSDTKNFICENIDSGACSSPSVSCYEATLGQTGTVVSSNTDSRPTSPCVNFTDTNTTLDPSDQISSTTGVGVNNGKRLINEKLCVFETEDLEQ
uniref:C-type lectin domain-containing protein n=1 Tax=Magallana gigas TaxID=29159 RepID=A0A8W8IRV1_MAGGI